MKKLTKKSLDELAKEMHVMSEEEQESMLGRAYYYDLYGNLIGICGDSSEIRVIDNSLYGAAIAGGLGGISGDGDWRNNLMGSIPFRDSTLQQRTNIIRSIGIQAGLSNYYMDIRDLDNYTRNGEYNHSTGMVTINSNSILFEFGNYNDFYCTLKHENYHKNNYIPNGSTAQMERDAYNHVLDQDQYDYASPYYKDLVARNYSHYSN